MVAKARSKKAVSSPQTPSKSNKKMNIGHYEDDDDDSNDKQSRGQWKWKLARLLKILHFILGMLTSTLVSTGAMLCIISTVFINNENNNVLQSTLLKIGMGYLSVVKPLLSTLATILHDGDDLQEGTMTRVIALSFLTSIVCNQLPKWLSKFVACFGIFAFGLASRGLGLHHHKHRHPSPITSEHESKSNNKAITSSCKNDDGSNSFQKLWSRLGLKERAALGGIAVVASLLIENFIIWVVSATYEPGITGSPEPLQDNGRIVLEKLAMKIYNVNVPWKAKQPLQQLRDGLNVQWALVSSLGASFVCLEMKLGKNNTRRSLASLALHALITLASARIIRTISFVLTVLPSQVPNCYARHFPPPPEEWREWLMTGFLPNSRGGCNDLILSGHATVTSTLGCAFTSAASNLSFSIAVWTLIALDYSIESYQGLHYSVDMWLGCIVTCLLWQLTKPLEDGKIVDHDTQHDGAEKEDAVVRPPPLNAQIVALYALPAALAFIILTVLPEAYVNYFLVGYSVSAGIIFGKCGFTHFLQHLLLCELCFGLGAYL